MTDVERSREGFRALIDKYPTAFVVEVQHQELAYKLHCERDQYQLMVSSGPWTTVTLWWKGDRFQEYAIWNRTGAVHEVIEGAVVDPALIEGVYSENS